MPVVFTKYTNDAHKVNSTGMPSWMECLDIPSVRNVITWRDEHPTAAAIADFLNNPSTMLTMSTLLLGDMVLLLV